MKYIILTFLTLLLCFSSYSQCLPTYSIGCSNGKYIDSVYLGGFLSFINRSSICTGMSPSFNTLYNDTVCLMKGQVHVTTVSTKDTTLYVTAFLDMNQDGDFYDFGESIQSVSSGGGFHIFQFVVPNTLNGTTKLRIVAADTIITDPCGIYTYGEVEEYYINATNPGPPQFTSCNCRTSGVINLHGCSGIVSPSTNHVWTASGNYRDTLINSSNCDSIIFVNLTIDTLNDSIYVQSDTLWAIDTGAQYQWYDCNAQAIIPNETSRWYKPSAAGSYACALTNGNCSAISACLRYSPNGLDPINKYSVSVYPNPAINRISISLAYSNRSTYQFVLYDQVGRKVAIHKLESDLTHVSLDNVVAGLYTYKLIRDVIAIETGKLVVDRK